MIYLVLRWSARWRPCLLMPNAVREYISCCDKVVRSSESRNTFAIFIHCTNSMFPHYIFTFFVWFTCSCTEIVQSCLSSLKLIRYVQLIYKDIRCAVVDEEEESERFNVKTGVRQGCVVSGFLFLLVLDFVMRKMTNNKDTGMRWKLATKLEDLDFADNIVLLTTAPHLVQRKTTRLQEQGARTSLEWVPRNRRWWE